MIRSLLTFIITGLLLGCSGPVQAPLPTKLTTEDYQLYSTILRDLLQAKTLPCVISRTTVPASAFETIKNCKVRFAHRSLLRTLQHQSTTTTLVSGFDADLQIALASTEEIVGRGEVYSIGRFWERLHKNYPNSRWVKFSIPAWNRKRTEALVYAEASSGELAGEGALYYLTKVNDQGRWGVLALYKLWIA